MFSFFLDSILERRAKGVLEKANIMISTKQASENNRNVKTQVIASSENEAEEISGKKIWVKDGYFKDQVTDYSMEKVNLPENSLLH